MRYLLTTILIVGFVLTGCSTEPPGTDQIKRDLLGKEIVTERGLLANSTWTFASMDEYVEVNIEDEQQDENTVEYTVDFVLRDMNTDELYEARLVLIYRNEEGDWGLESVSEKYFAEA